MLLTSAEAKDEDLDPEDFPDEIPEEVKMMACNVFGHVCPVFFVSEETTETSEPRRRGRFVLTYVKMRVARRDENTCQICGKHLMDNQIEFDHIIPVSKGGSSEEHNIRVTCFKCNRDKRDSVQI
jgi:5-methylcytosine-specific restriction endonuclease McrA